MKKAIGKLLIAVPFIPVVFLAMVSHFVIAAWQIGWDTAENVALYFFE